MNGLPRSPTRGSSFSSLAAEIPIRLLEWSTKASDTLSTTDRGTGRLSLVLSNQSGPSASPAGCGAAGFHLNIVNDDFHIQLLIDSSTVARREGDCSIVLSAAGAHTEYAIVFANAVPCSMFWIAVYVLINNQAESILAVPSLDNIGFLSRYLASLHPILKELVAHSAIRLVFIHGLFESFGLAEVGQRFDVMPLFSEVMVSLFKLNSRPLLSLLLSPKHIDHTIACLEYDSTLDRPSSYQTTHRRYLSQTKLHCVLPSLHDQIQLHATTNYRIAYLKSSVVGTQLNASVLATIDSIAAENNSAIAQVLMSDLSFGRKLVGTIVPVILSLNDAVMHSAEPSVPALRFLVELLSMPLPESALRRLVRKLCQNRLVETLDHAFANATESAAQCAVLDALTSLQQVAPDRVFEHLLSPECGMIKVMIKQLTDVSQMSVSCDRSFEYLQSLIQALDSDSQSYSVNDLVKLLLTSCIGSLRRGRSMSIVSIKQRKLSEFVGWLIQTRSDLCRTHFGGCLSWFVSLADHVLIDLQLSAEQKHLCMTSVRMLRSAASVSDPHFARSLVNRTGMSESVVLMLMANGGACNLLGSALQGMVCTMAEHWLQTLFSGRASKLVARMSPKSLSDSMQQLVFAFSAAVDKVCNKKTVDLPAKDGMPSLRRLNSLELVDMPQFEGPSEFNGVVRSEAVETVSQPVNAEVQVLREKCQELDQKLVAVEAKNRSENESMMSQLRQLRQQLAVQRMAALTSTVVRRQQNAAVGRWKSFAAASVPAVVAAPAPAPADVSSTDSDSSDPFLMDALYVLAWQRKVDRSRAMALALRLSLLPLLKRHHLRDSLWKWRESIRQSKLAEIVVQVQPQPVRQSEPISSSLLTAECPALHAAIQQAIPVADQMAWQSVKQCSSPADSFHSDGSCSSIGNSPYRVSSLHQSLVSMGSSIGSSMASTPTASAGHSFGFNPMLTRHSTRGDLGEELGDRLLKRTDSDMFFTIRTIKHGDSFLGCPPPSNSVVSKKRVTLLNRFQDAV